MNVAETSMSGVHSERHGTACSISRFFFDISCQAIKVSFYITEMGLTSFLFRNGFRERAIRPLSHCVHFQSIDHKQYMTQLSSRTRVMVSVLITGATHYLMSFELCFSLLR
jgi:hypothetical protein